MCASFDPAAPAGEPFRLAVQDALSAFLTDQQATLREIGPELEPVLAAAHDYTSGGKRLRPAFCYWGRVAAAGVPVDSAPLIRAAASLELLHVSALMHDDVMDHSDTRRGLPAAHKRFEAIHTAQQGAGSAAGYGTDIAILLGDLLLVWSAEMFAGSGLDPIRLAAATPLLEAVRTEVTCGQVLDVASQARLAGRGSESAVDLADRVVEYKSARYTVVRPAQIGVSLGGGSAILQQAMLDFGSPLGRAFQFRDDLLGVFGDAALTGKPAGGDLREGKRTLLVAHALAQSSAADAAVLEALLGRAELDDADVATAQRIIETSGARTRVEESIEKGYRQAVAVLEHTEMTDQGRRGLLELARQCVRRDT